jgi:hypothetical protein
MSFIRPKIIPSNNVSFSEMALVFKTNTNIGNIDNRSEIIFSTTFPDIKFSSFYKSSTTLISNFNTNANNNNNGDVLNITPDNDNIPLNGELSINNFKSAKQYNSDSITFNDSVTQNFDIYNYISSHYTTSALFKNKDVITLNINAGIEIVSTSSTAGALIINRTNMTHLKILKINVNRFITGKHGAALPNTQSNASGLNGGNGQGAGNGGPAISITGNVDVKIYIYGDNKISGGFGGNGGAGGASGIENVEPVDYDAGHTKLSTFADVYTRQGILDNKGYTAGTVIWGENNCWVVNIGVIVRDGYYIFFKDNDESTFATNTTGKTAYVADSTVGTNGYSRYVVGGSQKGSSTRCTYNNNYIFDVNKYESDTYDATHYNLDKENAIKSVVETVTREAEGETLQVLNQEPIAASRGAGGSFAITRTNNKGAIFASLRTNTLLRASTGDVTPGQTGTTGNGGTGGIHGTNGVNISNSPNYEVHLS